MFVGVSVNMLSDKEITALGTTVSRSIDIFLGLGYIPLGGYTLAQGKYQDICSFTIPAVGVHGLGVQSRNNSTTNKYPVTTDYDRLSSTYYYIAHG